MCPRPTSLRVQLLKKHYVARFASDTTASPTTRICGLDIMADAAASITALISFSVAIFQGCVKGYQLLSQAKHADQDVARIRCFLQWEEVKFVEFGRRAKIDGEVGSQNRWLPWQLIVNTLEELQVLFDDFEGLKSRYGLEPTADDEKPATEVDGRKGIAKLWAYASPETRALRARSAQKLGPVQRLRWVALDQSKITALISNLSECATFVLHLKFALTWGS